MEIILHKGCSPAFLCTMPCSTHSPFTFLNGEYLCFWEKSLLALELLQHHRMRDYGAFECSLDVFRIFLLCIRDISVYFLLVSQRLLLLVFLNFLEKCLEKSSF